MSSFRRPLIVTRKPLGFYDVDGFYKVLDDDITFEITASVQQISGSELASLPENRRELHTLKIYTDADLISIEQGVNNNPDLIAIDGALYEVYKKFSWKNDVINHYKYFLSKRTTNDAFPPKYEP